MKKVDYYIPTTDIFIINTEDCPLIVQDDNGAASKMSSNRCDLQSFSFLSTISLAREDNRLMRLGDKSNAIKFYSNYIGLTFPTLSHRHSSTLLYFIRFNFSSFCRYDETNLEYFSFSFLIDNKLCSESRKNYTCNTRTRKVNIPVTFNFCRLGQTFISVNIKINLESE